jgi:hypothetical protein
MYFGSLAFNLVKLTIESFAIVTNPPYELATVRRGALALVPRVTASKKSIAPEYLPIAERQGHLNCALGTTVACSR